MRESIEKVYIANDGTKFFNEKDCVNHEMNREMIKVKESLIALCDRTHKFTYNEYMEIDVCNNKKCPFYDNTCDCGCIAEKPILW